MSGLCLDTRPAHAGLASPPVASAWRWVHLGMAASAMVATLPGRTHGLGLITEPLLADLKLDRVTYASMNLWATLLGSAFCIPVGWLLDRLGVRFVLGVTLLLLGSTVVVMSRIDDNWQLAFSVSVMVDLFILILLTRGLGQSALSVLSLALMGKSAGPQSGRAIGVYSFLTALGFMAAFAMVKRSLEAWQADWRSLWAGIGLAILVWAPLMTLLIRPEGFVHDSRALHSAPDRPAHTLTQALRTPTFWIFALATSLYGLIAAGISLFNQAILKERGFEREVFLNITLVSPLVGLVSNLLTGWLAERWTMSRLLGIAMLGLTAALLAFPLVTTLPQVYAYAVVMGGAGGMVTVLFFGVWGRAFGVQHLGRIQGAAQMLTVLASAVGPLLVAETFRTTGSYLPLFRGLALAAGLLGVVAWCLPRPAPDTPGVPA